MTSKPPHQRHKNLPVLDQTLRKEGTPERPDAASRAARRRGASSVDEHGREGAAGGRPGSASAGFAAIQAAWARLFMTSLCRAGVHDIVISPGSRSTPFVLAAEFAGLHTHTIIDERSAGFFALGRARASGLPVALLCTSGSAGAHYYPAIIEAAQSFVPLVVVTADRPPELQGCAAPQTIDQTRLYGAFVRWFADLGPAQEEPASLRAVARKAAQAVATALGPIPGPVHINAPARKPLEPPGQGDSPADLAIAERADAIARTIHTRVARTRARASSAMVASLASACRATERGLIVCGPLLPGAAGEAGQTLGAAVQALAEATGFPLYCEASSQLRFCARDASAGPGSAGDAESSADSLCVDALDVVLSVPRLRRAARPDVIVQIGAAPAAMSWPAFVDENLDSVTCVIAEHGWNDATSAADLLVAADPTDTVIRLCDELGRSGGRAASRSRSVYSGGLLAASALAWRGVDAVLTGALDDDHADAEMMREGQAVHAALAALPPGSALVVGNSLPVRMVDLYCRAHTSVLSVLSQRGANGIDGLLSGAAGAAGGSLEGPSRRATLAVVGDVSFAHDVGGLAACARVGEPLILLVVDNQGGRIFELLPIARVEHGSTPVLFAEHWLTAPKSDIAALCTAYHIRYIKASNPAEVTEAVKQGARARECTVIHAVVEPSSAARDHRRIVAALDKAVAKAMVIEPDGLLARFLAGDRDQAQKGSRHGKDSP